MPDHVQAFCAAVFGALGHAPNVIEPGKLQRFSTNGRRGDSAGWCKLFDDLRAGVFGCWRQRIEQTWTTVDRRSMTLAERAALARRIEAARRERAEQRRAEWARNAKRIGQLWAQCVPVRGGDPVHRYLCGRLAVDAFIAPPCLRLHPALDYWHADGSKIGSLGTFPAMVAPVTAPNGRVVALHRTYLTVDGRKANVPTLRKLTAAAGPLAGASIRLRPPMHGLLGIAEGIETALAASLASGVPAVAAYCAGALAAFRQPATVTRLVIFADADATGREAAAELRARALRAALRGDDAKRRRRGLG
jgi:phage/plasmid primase-like uncharacterized protein